MSDEKPTLLEWLHINRKPDYSQYQLLGAFISFLLGLILFSIIIFGIYALILFFGALLGYGHFAGDTTGEAIRNLGLVLVAMFGAPFVVWRSIVAQKQVNVAEQGQITDRINKAVEGLGSEKTVKEVIETPRYRRGEDDWMRDPDGDLVPATRPDGTEIIDREVLERTVPNLEVRIGAIYALERIAKDSLRDHLQIMEILCAYIRENAPADSLVPTDPPFTRAVPRTDIQAAISVIGRRTLEQQKLEWHEEFRLDFRSTNLSGVNFSKGDFSAAMFHDCRLEGSIFDDCIFKGAQFYRSLLNFARFFNAELEGTQFDSAIINEPKNNALKSTGSINAGNIYGVSVVGSDLTAFSRFGTTEIMNLTFGSKDTKLSERLDFKRGKFEKLISEIEDLKEENKISEAEEKERELYKNNGFVDWFPHDSDDMAVYYYHRKFLQKLGLTGWPYQEE